jgi:hypothetical protein
VNKTLSLLSFKIGWALCIWAAIAHHASYAWLTGLALLTINISVQKKRRVALAKVGTAIFLGFAAEIINMHLGFYEFPNTDSIFPPLWLLAFWPVFSLLFIEFLDLFKHKPLWFHFLVGVTGAAGYYCGQWVNLILFKEPLLISLGLFCIVWSLQYIAIMKATEFVGKMSFLRD